LEHSSNEILRNYLSGALSETDTNACERHLAQCDVCRKQLAILVGLLDQELSSQEIAIVDLADAAVADHSPVSRGSFKVVPRPQSRFLPSRWMAAAVAASLVVAIVGAWLLVKNRPEAATQFVWSERTFEGRVSGQPYSEFIRIRTELPVEKEPPAATDPALAGASSLDLGRFYLRHHDFAQAINYLKMAKKTDPASAAVHSDLGVAYMESGREGALDDALSEFEEALRLDPQYAPALFNKAILYERMGRFREAEQQQRLYLQIDSDSGWAREVKSRLQASPR
jgi:tetratricopeptide (TPR) repeat protein